MKTLVQLSHETGKPYQTLHSRTRIRKIKPSKVIGPIRFYSADQIKKILRKSHVEK